MSTEGLGEEIRVRFSANLLWVHPSTQQATRDPALRGELGAVGGLNVGGVAQRVGLVDAWMRGRKGRGRKRASKGEVSQVDWPVLCSLRRPCAAAFPVPPGQLVPLQGWLS